MNKKSYDSLYRYCKYRTKNTQLAEDLLHDSIVVALEKKVNKLPTFVSKTFKFNLITHLRTKDLETRNYNLFAVDTSIPSPIMYGEAIDMIKAVNILTAAVKKKFNYFKSKDSSKRVEAFIRYTLWKESPEEVAKALGSSSNSIINMCSSTVQLLYKDKNLVPYLDIIKEFSHNNKSPKLRIPRRRTHS